MKKIMSFLLAAAMACSAGTPKKISSDLTSAEKKGSAVQVIIQWSVDIGAATAQKIAALGGTVI
ncbi:MAG TPA: hypothetical protein VM715_12940, partial [Candidatus Acidoferrum sp.]|nr:hypothetical protein [Candidatus Acidoferrum sp.]